MKDNIYTRMQKAEAMTNLQKSELPEIQETAYRHACEQRDEESAAELARKIRNRLLAESDKEMSLDRLGLTVPSGSTFTAWLSFLRNLGGALSGAWANYRQALRDLPEQEGFPFDITFPEKPTDE